MKPCEICNNKGWIYSWSEGRENMADGYHIEKCDTCEENGTATFKTDRAAIEFFATLIGVTTENALKLDEEAKCPEFL